MTHLPPPPVVLLASLSFTCVFTATTTTTLTPNHLTPHMLTRKQGLLSLLYQICEGDVPQLPDRYDKELM